MKQQSRHGGYIIKFDEAWDKLPGMKPMMASAKVQERLARRSPAAVRAVALAIAHGLCIGGEPI